MEGRHTRIFLQDRRGRTHPAIGDESFGLRLAYPAIRAGQEPVRRILTGFFHSRITKLLSLSGRKLRAGCHRAGGVHQGRDAYLHFGYTPERRRSQLISILLSDKRLRYRDARAIAGLGDDASGNHPDEVAIVGEKESGYLLST